MNVTYFFIMYFYFLWASRDQKHNCWGIASTTRGLLVSLTGPLVQTAIQRYESARCLRMMGSKLRSDVSVFGRRGWPQFLMLHRLLCSELESQTLWEVRGASLHTQALGWVQGAGVYQWIWPQFSAAFLPLDLPLPFPILWLLPLPITTWCSSLNSDPLPTSPRGICIVSLTPDCVIKTFAPR